jgi:hypothetical protein
VFVGRLHSSHLPDHISVAALAGDGSNITHVNAANIKTSKLNNKQLNNATKISEGICRFANEAERQSSAEYLAVSADALQETLVGSRSYTDPNKSSTLYHKHKPIRRI